MFDPQADAVRQCQAMAGLLANVATTGTPAVPNLMRRRREGDFTTGFAAGATTLSGVESWFVSFIAGLMDRNFMVGNSPDVGTLMVSAEPEKNRARKQLSTFYAENHKRA
jgi:hypothetical protein